MPYTTLISAAQLQALQASATPAVVFDCSCDLMQPAQGPAQYAESHIAGALYAHLDNNLSAKGDPAVTGAQSGGRHPLPAREKFAQWLGSMGLNNTDQVVVYDRQGANYCGRLWWMLKWCGHEAVAVLDGGFQAWQASGAPVASGSEHEPATPGSFVLQPARVVTADTGGIARRLGTPEQTLIDARGAPRFRGEVEPLDPVAGHIPGALNRPFVQNIGEDGRFKPAHVLHPSAQYCGAVRLVEIGLGATDVPVRACM